MGLPDPSDVAASDDAVSGVIGDRETLSGPIEIRAYDPSWPERYAREAEGVRRALGDRVVRLEHVGSTAVPGLAAKPVIDMALEVLVSADEPAYVPDLEAIGYQLRIREPGWFEHRLLKAPGINLHVFPAGCSETDRMVLFRDWLRADAPDRDKYARAKLELARRDWKYVQQYADAKTAIVTEILARAIAGGGGSAPR